MSKTVSDLVRQCTHLMIMCVLLCGCRSAKSVPSIEFSQVPQAAEGGPDKLETIRGRVRNAQPDQQIVLYVKSGVLWWIQPRVDQPFTIIQPDSTWQSPTHLGTEYAALLVKSGYRPPATTEVLPTSGNNVIAVVVAKGENAMAMLPQTLRFSGYEWKLRTAVSDRGGTANLYDPANAWTDENGFLHLRITQRSGKWTCAEVKLTRSLGYGSYRFIVQKSSHLEPAAVLSMFTWDDLESDQNHREMGVELTRWGDPDNKNAQYVIQPFYVPSHVTRFAAPSGVLAHSFRWEPERATFKTVAGTGARDGARVVAEHVFTAGIPAPGGEAIHLNLYVFGTGKNPLQHETEVVVEKFEYLP